jgi:hypothetical protein
MILRPDGCAKKIASRDRHLAGTAAAGSADQIDSGRTDNEEPAPLTADRLRSPRGLSPSAGSATAAIFEEEIAEREAKCHDSGPLLVR